MRYDLYIYIYIYMSLGAKGLITDTLSQAACDPHTVDLPLRGALPLLAGTVLRVTDYRKIMGTCMS